jgi:hypothetical protein
MIDKLTPYLATNIISDSEKRIIVLSQDVQKLKPQVDEYKAAYLKLQFEYDQANEKLEQERDLLDWVSKQKNGIPQKEKIMVMRSTSHNDMRDSEKKRYRSKFKKNFHWVEYAQAVLRERDVFLTADELWDAMCDRYNIIERLNELGAQKGKTKYGAIKTSIAGNIESTKMGRKGGLLISFNDHYGLAEWVTDDFKPKGKYAVQRLMNR